MQNSKPERIDSQKLKQMNLPRDKVKTQEEQSLQRQTYS